MNVRVFWVCAMKCMYAQARPRFILSSEGVLERMEFEPMLTPREKSPLPKMSPEEDRTRDTVDSEPKHYQLSYSGPTVLCDNGVVGLILLWASGRGDFSLGVNMYFLTPFPQNSFGWEYKLRSVHTCTPWHRLKRSWHSCPDGWMLATKTHPACTATKTECD